MHGHRPSPWNRWVGIRHSGRSRSYSLANGDLGCSRISPHEAVLTASQLWKTLLRGMKEYQYVGLRSVPLFTESLPWPRLGPAVPSVKTVRTALESGPFDGGPKVLGDHTVSAWIALTCFHYRGRADAGRHPGDPSGGSACLFKPRSQSADVDPRCRLGANSTLAVTP